MITTQIVTHVVNADLVVADLSESNANAFYELAVRHAFRKPFVQLISRDSRLPFDVAGLRTVIYNLADPDSVDEARRELDRHVAVLEDDPTSVATPISMALDLEQMRESGDSTSRTLAEIQNSIYEVRAHVEMRLQGMMSSLVGPAGWDAILIFLASDGTQRDANLFARGGAPHFFGPRLERYRELLDEIERVWYPSRATETPVEPGQAAD